MKSAYRVVLFIISTYITMNVMNAQWVRQNSGTMSVLTDVVMLDSTIAIVVGWDNLILKTTNSGTVWTQIGLPINSLVKLNVVSFFDNKNGIVAGDLVAITTTGGELWNFCPRPGKGKCLSALQIGPANMYVGDDSGWVCHSLDMGKTWASEKISVWPILSLFAWRGAYLDGLPIYALTPYSLFTRLEFSPGGSWSETILPFHGLGSAAYSGEFCNGGGAGFIVGVQGDLVTAPTIVRKSVSDSIWRSLSTGIPYGGTLLGVSAPSDNIIYVCGSNGMMYKSMDGGDSWKASLVPTKRLLSSVYFYNEDRGFAVGDSGSIFFTSNGATSVNESGNSLPLEFTLLQNYPNPFNPSTTFEFVLPLASEASLKVFNVLGQEIVTILDDYLAAGTHKVQWNAQAFTSGIYFYRLQAREVSLIKKMVLIK